MMKKACQAEIEDFRRPGGRQHDVARLQVPVKDAAAMRVLERVANLCADPRQLAQFERSPLQPRLKGAAGDVLHDQEVHVVLCVEVEDGRDARMGQPGEHVGLAAKPLARRRVCKRTAEDHLYRDVAIQVEVVRAIHLAHAAGADRLEDSIVRKGGSDHSWAPADGCA